jgi:hypothetical protein
MPGRVASTVARPAERRQIYAAAKFAGAITSSTHWPTPFPEESHRDHEEDRKQGLSSRATKQMLNIGDRLKLIQTSFTRERSVTSPA